jgi:tetratricopeptide (TPR) repeat protein
MTDDRVPRDTPALPHLPLQLPDLSALAFGGSGDLGDHFRRLDEITRRRADQKAAPSTLLLPDFVTLAAEDSLDLGEEGEDLLEDARANIARGEYALAVEQLTEFLELSPGHPQARYLQAYCHYRLDDLMTALKITLPMLRARLDDPVVRKGVLGLRATVCDVLTPQEIGIFFDTRHRDPRAADDRLQRFIEVAPEETEPPYLLALMLAIDGDFTSAYRTAQNAVDQADGEVDHLRALADALAVRAVRPMASDAVQALTDGAYRRARQALTRLDRQWRETEPLRDLDRFLADLVRTGHSPAKPLPAPKIPADRTMRLYVLIADEYRQEALDLVADQRWADAERVLARILHLVPTYPPPNYVYAFCLLAQGKEPERAIAAAEIAADDPTLPDARMLLRAVKQMREVLTINAAYEEHNNAVRAVGSPPTRQQLIVLRSAMEQLRHRIPKLGTIATNRQSAKRVRELDQAATRQLEEVDRAIANLEVSDLADRFNRWAKDPVFGSLPPGIVRLLPRGDRLSGGLIGGSTEPTEIRREARRLLNSTTDPQARTVLEDILTAVDRFW